MRKQDIAAGAVTHGLTGEKGRLFTFNILILKTVYMRGQRLLNIQRGDWDASFHFPADSILILLGLCFQCRRLIFPR